MNLEEAKKVMKDADNGFLATTDGERAAVRPMGGWAWVGRELWCATGAKSSKVAEIKKKSHVEYCFADKNWKHVRISGPTSVSADNADKQKLYDLVPELKKYISDPKSPDYVVLRTRVEKIRYMGSADMEYTNVALP